MGYEGKNPKYPLKSGYSLFNHPATEFFHFKMYGLQNALLPVRPYPSWVRKSPHAAQIQVASSAMGSQCFGPFCSPIM